MGADYGFEPAGSGLPSDKAAAFALTDTVIRV